MEALLRLIKENIKRGLPPTFGAIFDGWSCDGEHYIGAFATWVRDDGLTRPRLTLETHMHMRMLISVRRKRDDSSSSQQPQRQRAVGGYRTSYEVHYP